MSSYAESTRPLTRGSIAPYSPSISESADTAVEQSNLRPPSRACSVYGECNNGSEETPKRACHGWPELTGLMTENPGLESFQIFRDLNIKSLLYYQGELCSLREQLHELEWKDHRTGTFSHAKEFCSNIEFLVDSENDQAGPYRKRKQMALVRKIRGVLKEYNEALLQYSKVNELPAADEFNVNSLRTWLIDRKLGWGHVQGPGQHSWGDLRDSDLHTKTFTEHLIHLLRSLTIFWAETPEKGKHPDLVVPRRIKQIDSFTRWIANDWIPFWHCLEGMIRKSKDNTAKNEKELPTSSTNRQDYQAGRHYSTSSKSSSISGWLSRIKSPPKTDSRDTSEERPTLTTYRMSRMRKFTSFLTTIVACLLPTAAIAVLATIHSQAELIGFIALFTATFAMVLMTFTAPGTPTTDIFTATAAFSAVLVVFVQNQQQIAVGGT